MQLIIRAPGEEDIFTRPPMPVDILFLAGDDGSHCGATNVAAPGIIPAIADLEIHCTTHIPAAAVANRD
jgi:hypothetical protein